MSVIKKGAFSEDEWEKVLEKHNEIPKRQMEIIEAGGMTVSEIRADAIAHRFDFIVVDYLQLIQVNGRGTRSDEVAEISRSLHTMSQRDKITVLALSQLTRPEKVKGGAAIAPTMQHLRESGQIEQDADVVLLLYDADAENPNQRILKVAKNKEGQKGTILMDFDGATQTFTEAVVDGRGTAREYCESGKKHKQIRQAEASMDQVPLTPITGEDADLPF
jgi:replicative DNA helicase